MCSSCFLIVFGGAGLIHLALNVIADYIEMPRPGLPPGW
jgi:hypothetical protein